MRSMVTRAPDLRAKSRRYQGACVIRASDLTRVQNWRNGFRINSMRALAWEMPQERQALMDRLYSRCDLSLPDMRRPKCPDPVPLTSPSRWENTTGSNSAGVHIRPSRPTPLPHPESPRKAADKGSRSRGAGQTIVVPVLHQPSPQLAQASRHRPPPSSHTGYPDVEAAGAEHPSPWTWRSCPQHDHRCEYDQPLVQPNHFCGAHLTLHQRREGSTSNWLSNRRPRDQKAQPLPSASSGSRCRDGATPRRQQ